MVWPLQSSVPGGLEIVVVLLFVVVPILLASVVYTDARRRENDNAGGWALLVGALSLFSLVGGLIALAVYLRDRH